MQIGGEERLEEIFVSLEEAAILEELTYKGMSSKIQRNLEEFIVKTKSGDRGKDKVFVALSSLSKKARRKYKQALSVDVKDVLIESNTKGENVPWYITMDSNWYIENYTKEYYKAVELSRYVKDFLDCPKRTNRSDLSNEMAKAFKISKRSFQRYVKDYVEASAWAMKMQKYDFGNYEFFKILSLCRKPREKGSFPSLSERVKAYIENIWFNKDFAANMGTVEMLYSKLSEIANEQGVAYPSYQTVYRYINYLMEEKRGKNAHYMASKGLREYKNKVMVKGSRDTGSLKVMQVLQGDEHTFDCWVAYKHPNGKVTAIRPTLVAWIDTRSRLVLGDVICKKANSDILKQSLLKVIYGDVGGVPEYLLIDNGKDYTAKEMTGRHRNDKRDELSFDSETVGFYKSLGIKADKRSLPYEPWSKAQIERFFGRVCSDFTKWMQSYTGTLTGSKTASKVKKNTQKMLENETLMSMQEFYEHWSKWLRERYYNSEHSGLKKQKERYKTPLEVFKNEERYYKAPPPRSYATMIMMKAERVHVYNVGIRKFGQEYRSQELTSYIGDKVDIRWDIQDITKIYVYTTNGKFIGEALSQELLQIAPKVSQKALEEHLMMQNRQIKEDKDRLREYNTPFEERIARYNEALSETVGVVDIVKKGKGAKQVNQDKVISLPNDKQYSDEVKSKKIKRQENTSSDFFNKKAESVLSKLRTLG